jgi:glutamate-1-semialdehyde 2,1-aminomutase
MNQGIGFWLCSGLSCRGIYLANASQEGEMADYAKVFAELSDEYRAHSPRSAALQERAARVMVDGGNHGIRLMQPFPLRIVSAEGAWLTDADSHRILDFWQGHWANILGHNPPAITEVLARDFEQRRGLQTGFTDELQIATAELLCRRTGAERVRFTTSGTLATMYAIMLARSFSGRDLVMKIGGGWHGAQPWGLKGVHLSHGGFGEVDSAGITKRLTEEILVTRYNDPEQLREGFRKFGDRISCFILEPSMGAGGGMPATREFLQTARELTARHGTILIFDEIISGFRFRAGDAGNLAGVQPDLAVFGKVMSGGTPVSAVAGRADILDLSGRPGGHRVGFSGGTFSAHPACMLAAKTMMSYLEDHESEIYPRLSALAEKARDMIESTFAAAGIHAVCAGRGNDAFPPSSLIRVHFPLSDRKTIDRPEDALDPAICDVALSEKILRVAMLLENVNVMFGLGSLSSEHTEEDLGLVRSAFERVAARLRRLR